MKNQNRQRQHKAVHAILVFCVANPLWAAYKSRLDVQYGQRTAFKGIFDRQNGQSLVFGGASTGFCLNRLICTIIM
jgi:hypothetical protein